LSYFNKEQIKEIIPHRDPMLLVDEVVDMIPGEVIKAKFFIDPKREIFKGHFPGEPVFPGVYTVECMAQTADILILCMEKYKGKIPLFLGINNVRFMRKIMPDDTIEISAKILVVREDKGIITCNAEVFNRGELAASGEVTIAMR
jgi:3-hydroxyacyl-[acyl-carrier-protein] dehydratase